jgi:hypothetical protein
MHGQRVITEIAWREGVKVEERSAFEDAGSGCWANQTAGIGGELVDQ